MPYLPDKHPSFSVSSDILSILLCFFIFAANPATSFSKPEPRTILPSKDVPERELRTSRRRLYPAWWCKQAEGQGFLLFLKSISTPALLPIQFSCIIFTRAGQPSSVFKIVQQPVRVIRYFRNHCSISVFTTSLWHLQHKPSFTCSLASTVEQEPQKFTVPFFL